MASSPARLAANRSNALKSTGPKSAEGKAVSRGNAFKHGLAGAGDLVAPGEDLTVIGDRSAAFVEELGAVGRVGRLLAHRAALLSVRMEQSAVRDLVRVAADVRAARAEFDEERVADVDRLIDAVRDFNNVRAIIEALEKTPEGVAYLLDAWAESLAEAELADDPYSVESAADRVERWLALTEEEGEALAKDSVACRQRIEAEMARLRGLLDPLTAETDAGRDEAGIMASFDPGPEATLARRYEAAAERGMYRAIRAIAVIRREQEDEITHPEAFTKAFSLPPIPSPLPPTAPMSFPPPRPSTEPLGSFRAEVAVSASPPPKPLLGPIEPSMIPVGHPKKRPDLRKLALNRR